MQCKSCQFENLPGTEFCGRCGAPMELAAAAVNVHPPRAGKWEKRLTRTLPTFGLLDRARYAASEAATALDIGLRPGLFFRVVVPGWPQMACGRATRGRLLFWGYLGALLAGLLFVGTFPGSLLLGLAVSLHAATVMDLIFHATQDRSLRFLYCLGAVAVVAGVLYLPAGWLVTRVASPQRIMMTAEPFRAGDVILYSRWAYRNSPPRLGDVVFYEIPAHQVQGRAGGYPALYNIQGPRIDRIVAGPGQGVECKSGEIWIDGRRSPWLPLNPQRMPSGLKLTVPDRHYLIFPTTNPQQFEGIGGAGWSAVSLVPAGNVRGRVYLRNQPLWRLWFIR